MLPSVGQVLDMKSWAWITQAYLQMAGEYVR